MPPKYKQGDCVHLVQGTLFRGSIVRDRCGFDIHRFKGMDRFIPFYVTKYSAPDDSNSMILVAKTREAALRGGSSNYVYEDMVVPGAQDGDLVYRVVGSEGKGRDIEIPPVAGLAALAEVLAKSIGKSPGWMDENPKGTPALFEFMGYTFREIGTYKDGEVI